MRRRDFLTGAAALAAYGQIQEAEALTPHQRLFLGGPRQVDVFIFAGQSNAVVNNTSLGALPANIVADAGIRVWDKVSQTWQQYNATVNSNQPGDVSPSIGAYWGAEAEFARQYRLANPGKTAYIIHYAIGTTQLYNATNVPTWNPAADNTQLFYLATVQINAALAALRAAGLAPVVRAVSWMQGEQDATGAVTAAAYTANLAAFETAFRAQWSAANAIFIIGQTNGGSFVANVNIGQNLRCTANPLNRIINTAAYLFGTDSVHIRDDYVQVFGADQSISYSTTCRDNRLPNSTFSTSDLSAWVGKSYNGVLFVTDATIMSVVGGRLRCTNSTGHMLADATYAMTDLVVGRTYSVTGDIFSTGVQPGIIRISSTSDGATTVKDSGSIAVDTSIGYSFVAAATTAYLCCLIPNQVAGICEFDNVVVKGI